MDKLEYLISGQEKSYIKFESIQLFKMGCQPSKEAVIQAKEISTQSESM